MGIICYNNRKDKDELNKMSLTEKITEYQTSQYALKSEYFKSKDIEINLILS